MGSTKYTVQSTQYKVHSTKYTVQSTPPKNKGQLFKKLRKRLFVGTVPPKKRRKSVNYLKIKEEVICRNSPTKKKGKKCQFWKSLGRGYMSEQSHQKKRRKVSILEKFRKRLFVGTVPPKKGRKRVNYLKI